MGLLSWTLDRSILFSYDRTGFQRHARRFKPADLDRSMAGQVCLVTGASSGLGTAVVRGLASRGAQVHLLCRNPTKGAQTLQAISDETGSQDLHLGQVDLSDLSAVRAYAEGASMTSIDVLVHNAGVLPASRQMTVDGLELTVATNLVGPFALTHLLWPRLSPTARIIHVSSGGMYSERLDVERLFQPPEPFDGVRAYAQTKRAQVALSQFLSERSDFAVSSMHPGWADTPGVERSLPTFHRVTRRILRTPDQGADTIVWLAVAEAAAQPQGRFFFDREPVPAHLSRRTVASEAETERLFQALCHHAGADPDTAMR